MQAQVSGGRGLRHGQVDLLTNDAVENAMLAHAAFGGSTNLVLHLPAIAHAAGLRVPTVAERQRVDRAAPWLVDALPNGPRDHPTVRVFLAGGVPEVMLHLRRMGLLQRSAPTVTGESLDANLDWWEARERRGPWGKSVAVITDARFSGVSTGACIGASFTPAYAYIADVTPPEKRAQHFGLIGAAFGGGFILGPAIGGLLGTLGRGRRSSPPRASASSTSHMASSFSPSRSPPTSVVRSTGAAPTRSARCSRCAGCRSSAACWWRSFSGSSRTR
jgi:MFS family permease